MHPKINTQRSAIKMNLAFCLFNYFPFGGLERNFMAISQECIKRGHTIDVYTMSYEGEPPKGLNVNIVSVRGASNHSKAAAFSKYMATNINRSNYDLVMGFNKSPGLDLYYAADVCYAARIDRQRNFLSKLTPRYRIFSDFEKAVFSPDSPTHIIYISRQEKIIYQDTYKTQENRFHYAPPGINKEKIQEDITFQNRQETRHLLSINEQDNLLLMVGSNFKTKGVDRSIRALASLPDKLRGSTYLFIIGKGKEKNYKKMAASLGIGDNVHFLGTRDDVSLYLAGADFLLQPSLNENTGNAIVEALVAGIPVLATENCGYAEHIRLANAGRVVPSSPFAQESMDMTLKEMLLSNERDAWKKNALAYADRTDLYNRLNVICDIIESIATRKSSKV